MFCFLSRASNEQNPVELPPICCPLVCLFARTGCVGLLQEAAVDRVKLCCRRRLASPAHARTHHLAAPLPSPPLHRLQAPAVGGHLNALARNRAPWRMRRGNAASAWPLRTPPTRLPGQLPLRRMPRAAPSHPTSNAPISHPCHAPAHVPNKCRRAFKKRLQPKCSRPAHPPAHAPAEP